MLRILALASEPALFPSDLLTVLILDASSKLTPTRCEKDRVTVEREDSPIDDMTCLTDCRWTILVSVSFGPNSDLHVL